MVKIKLPHCYEWKLVYFLEDLSLQNMFVFKCKMFLFPLSQRLLEKGIVKCFYTKMCWNGLMNILKLKAIRHLHYGSNSPSQKYDFSNNILYSNPAVNRMFILPYLSGPCGSPWSLFLSASSQQALSKTTVIWMRTLTIVWMASLMMN